MGGLRLLFAWVVLAGPLVVPTVAAEAAPVAQPTASTSLELARTLFPKEVLPAFRSDFAAEFEKGFGSSPQATRMEAVFPGFTKRFAKEAAIEVRVLASARLPLLHAKVAELYDAQLSPSEQQEYLAFARSGPGQRLLHAVAANQDIQSLAKAVAKDGKVTRETQEQQLAIAALGASQTMSDEDRDAIARFLQSPAGIKAAKVDEQVQPILADWVNSGRPEGSKKMEAVALRVARDMAREGAK